VRRERGKSGEREEDGGRKPKRRSHQSRMYVPRTTSVPRPRRSCGRAHHGPPQSVVRVRVSLAATCFGRRPATFNSSRRRPLIEPTSA
ncbi:unnamed protein product, partial [Pylaiella littoralis]